MENRNNQYRIILQQLIENPEWKATKQAAANLTVYLRI